MTEPIPPILDDRPAREDTLGFQPYVDALADILLDPATHTPLVVGVYGPWGSGKTSLRLYEAGQEQPYESVVFARFPLAWLTERGENPPA
jgi:predicted KAP-like P-loop ATPase